MLSSYSFKWTEYKAYFCNLSVLSRDSFVNDMLHSQVSARQRGSFSANKEQLFPNKYINGSKCGCEDLRKSSVRQNASGSKAASASAQSAWPSGRRPARCWQIWPIRLSGVIQVPCVKLVCGQRAQHQADNAQESSTVFPGSL